MEFMSSGRFKFNLEMLPGGQLYTVVNGLIIGRERGSVLFKTDLLMSGIHAQFQVDVDKVYITDLNTSNGITINGKRIASDTPTLLNHQDRIEVGAQIFIFMATDTDQSYPEIEEAPKLQFSDDDHQETVLAPLNRDKKPK